MLRKAKAMFQRTHSVIRTAGAYTISIKLSRKTTKVAKLMAARFRRVTKSQRKGKAAQTNQVLAHYPIWVDLHYP